MNLREKLILAAIDVIEKEGMTGFTIRRVATACGVSCAAPYKHFTDKEDLFVSVLNYVRQKWYEEQESVVKKYEGDVQRQLTAVSMAYIKFLTENPHFRAVIMVRDENMTPEQQKEKAAMSSYSRELVSVWCIKAGYTHEQSVRKTYVVRSFIYGAVIMFESGELEYNEESMSMIERCIKREFEIE